MAMKMKGIYKSLKSISQVFVVQEREMEIGYPQDVKHVAHIGWEGSSSGSAPDWMSEFKVAAEQLSPRASSFSHATHSNSLCTNSDVDQGSNQSTVPDRVRDVPPIPVGVSKIQTKTKGRRKKTSSTSTPRSKSSPKSARATSFAKSSYKSMISRLNSNA